MIASWKISIERSLFHNVLLGYNVQIDIQGSTSLSSSIINLPNIALVDNEAEENRYLDKLRDKCQILFYNDFIFNTNVISIGIIR